MKKIIFLSLLPLAFSLAAQARPLTGKEADSICRKKALRAAHFISESNRKLVVRFKASDVAEISTPIRYEFTYPGVKEVLFTVDAYAYPDDRFCLIGSITNHIAGND